MRKIDIMWANLVPLAIAMIVFALWQSGRDEPFPGEDTPASFIWPALAVVVSIVAIIAIAIFLIRRKKRP